MLFGQRGFEGLYSWGRVVLKESVDLVVGAYGEQDVQLAQVESVETVSCLVVVMEDEWVPVAVVALVGMEVLRHRLEV